MNKERELFTTIFEPSLQKIQDSLLQVKYNNHYSYCDADTIELAGHNHHGGIMVADGPLTLITEPDNPADKHAIAVYFDGIKIAYVARKETDALWRVIEQEEDGYEVDFVSGTRANKVYCFSVTHTLLYRRW